MKKVMVLVSLSAVAFAAGTLVSCSPNGGQAPDPVPPMTGYPGGSYLNPTK